MIKEQQKILINLIIEILDYNSGYIDFNELIENTKYERENIDLKLWHEILGTITELIWRYL